MTLSAQHRQIDDAGEDKPPSPGASAANNASVAPAQETGSGAAEGDGNPAPPGFTALVVEDSMLIAMDAEEALQELGASAVTLCPDVASALASIGASAGARAFDVALLDVNLGGETSEAVAVALREAGTPFIMITGLGDYVGDYSAYAGAPVLTKPYVLASLSHALAQVLDGFPEVS